MNADGESRKGECSPSDVEETRGPSCVIELHLPQLRAGAFESAPSVACAIGYFEDTDIQRSHCGEPLALFCCDVVAEATHTHTR